MCAERSGSTGKTTSGGKNEQGKGEGLPGGGRLPPEQGSSRESEGQKKRFLLQYFPSGQEGRRAQASHKPEWPQRVHEEKDFLAGFIKNVSQSLRSGDWAATMDLKDAHLHVPIAAQHRRFLWFWWKGCSYQLRRALRTEFSTPNFHEAHFASPHETRVGYSGESGFHRNPK